MNYKSLIAGLLLLSGFLAGLYWKEKSEFGQAQETFAAEKEADQQLLLTVSHQKELYRLQTQLGDLSAAFQYLQKSKTYVEALNDLIWGYDHLKAEKAASFGSKILKNYYKDSLFAAAGDAQDSIIAHWFPKDPIAIYLQSFYMAGQNRWDKDHPHHYIPAFFGPDLEASAQMMRAKNIWLLGPKGHVVYSVGDHSLLGVNLLEDPFSTSLAGQLLEDVLSQKDGLVLGQKKNPIDGSVNNLLMGATMGTVKKTTGFLLVQFESALILPNLSENILHSFSWQPLEIKAEGDTLVSRIEVEGVSLWLESWTNTLLEKEG